MQEMTYPTPNCPVELFKLNEIQRELESPQAFADLVQDCQSEFDPSVTQVLQAVNMLVGQLTRYHWDQLQYGELDPYVETLWEEDYQTLKKAAALLRQVRAD